MSNGGERGDEGTDNLNKSRELNPFKVEAITPVDSFAKFITTLEYKKVLPSDSLIFGTLRAVLTASNKTEVLDTVYQASRPTEKTFISGFLKAIKSPGINSKLFTDINDAAQLLKSDKLSVEVIELAEKFEQELYSRTAEYLNESIIPLEIDFLEEVKRIEDLIKTPRPKTERQLSTKETPLERQLRQERIYNQEMTDAGYSHRTPERGDPDWEYNSKKSHRRAVFSEASPRYQEVEIETPGQSQAAHPELRRPIAKLLETTCKLMLTSRPILETPVLQEAIAFINELATEEINNNDRIFTELYEPDFEGARTHPEANFDDYIEKLEGIAINTIASQNPVLGSRVLGRLRTIAKLLSHAGINTRFPSDLTSPSKLMANYLGVYQYRKLSERIPNMTGNIRQLSNAAAILDSFYQQAINRIKLELFTHHPESIEATLKARGYDPVKVSIENLQLWISPEPEITARVRSIVGEPDSDQLVKKAKRRKNLAGLTDLELYEFLSTGLQFPEQMPQPSEIRRDFDEDKKYSKADLNILEILAQLDGDYKITTGSEETPRYLYRASAEDVQKTLTNLDNQTQNYSNTTPPRNRGKKIEKVTIETQKLQRAEVVAREEQNDPWAENPDYVYRPFLPPNRNGAEAMIANLEVTDANGKPIEAARVVTSPSGAQFVLFADAAGELDAETKDRVEQGFRVRLNTMVVDNSEKKGFITRLLTKNNQPTQQEGQSLRRRINPDRKDGLIKILNTFQLNTLAEQIKNTNDDLGSIIAAIQLGSTYPFETHGSKIVRDALDQQISDEINSLLFRRPESLTPDETSAAELIKMLVPLRFVGDGMPVLLCGDASILAHAIMKYLDPDVAANFEPRTCMTQTEGKNSYSQILHAVLYNRRTGEEIDPTPSINHLPPEQLDKLQRLEQQFRDLTDKE